MKHFLPLMVAVFLGLSLAARAQGPDEQYIQIYDVMQQAEGLRGSGQDNAALQKYLEAESSLKKFKTIYPDWNPRIVDFRLKYLASRIAPLTAKSKTRERTAPSLDLELSASTDGATNESAAVDYAARVEDLEGRVQQLESEKVVLESKLKEALSVQPAAVDPAELEQAQQRISQLDQENESLKTELRTERERTAQLIPPAEVETIRAELAEANRKLTEQLDVARTLQQEKELLQQKLESSSQTSSADTAALEGLRAENARLKSLLSESEQRTSVLQDTQRELEAARRQIQEQSRSIAQLESRARSTPGGGTTVTAEELNSLRTENARLKHQIADANLKLKQAESLTTTTRFQGDAAAVIAALKSDMETLQLEKTALQNRVRTLSRAPAAAPAITATAPPAGPSPETAEQIKRLQAEKEDLETRLQSATAQLYGSDTRTQERVQEMADQMASLRARLEVLEARRVPYTEEELALMKGPAPAPASADSTAGSNNSSVSKLSPASAELVAQAQRAFRRGDYTEAEENYRAVLDRDENNVYTLGNLAAIQLEQGKIAEAEANLTKALSAQPEDAFSLSLLGYLRFQENKLDEALDALGRSAKLNPQSAETQNYLGIVLSHKGFRGPAETALRRAIQLKPDYASAHNNLAVIYITQDPPMVQLARWHYQKARTNGHPANAELEKMIEKAGGASASQ